MRFNFILLGFFLLLLLGTASAEFEICDSIERDVNSSLFRCNLFETKYYVSQQDIDEFWEDMQNYGYYKLGQIETVEWEMRNSVLQVSDDLWFVQAEGLDLAWDIVMQGDTNTTHDINEAQATGPRAANHTAIKERIDSMQNYKISFAPLGERKSVRNLTMDRPTGAFAVYIAGNSVKKMVMDLQGNLTLSGAYIENAEYIKAKDINLSNDSYLKNIGSIEARNLSVSGSSYIRKVGGMAQKAIVLQDSGTGLQVTGTSYIDDLTGGIECDSNIAIKSNSKIENLQYSPSNAIQWIHAESLVLEGSSWIRGFGGNPGEIILDGPLIMNDSKIMGKPDYKPSLLSAVSISMADDAFLQDFAGTIVVTGKTLFSLDSGAMIKDFGGNIDSCAPLSIDGNRARIFFTSGSQKIIKAKSLDVNATDLNKAIVCLGSETCEYNFIARECGTEPAVGLEVVGSPSGESPLTVEFTGFCGGDSPILACTINFGDDSPEIEFDGNTTHTFETPGEYTVWLTATNIDGISTRIDALVWVREPGEPATGSVDASLSAITVKRGDELYVDVTSMTALQSFSLKSDLAVTPITAVPAEFPARLGPIIIPDDAPAGTHTITVSGSTAEGIPFSKILIFTVEEGDFLAVIFGSIGEFLPFIAIGVVAVIVVIVVVILVKKRRGEKPDKKKKLAKMMKPGPKAPKEAVPWLIRERTPEEEEIIVEEEPAAEEKEAAEEKPKAPAEPAEEKKPEEKPEKKKGFFGWRRKKPAPEKKPAAKPVPEKKPAAVPEEKPLGVTSKSLEPRHAKPVQPAGLEDLLDEIKKTPSREELPPVPKEGDVGKVPAKEPLPRPVEKEWPEKPLPEEKPKIPEKPAEEKKPEEKPEKKKGFFGWRKKKPEPEKKPAARPVPEETPAPAGLEKGPEKKPKEKPVEKRLWALGLKKKPKKKEAEEKPSSEQELPGWLKKTDEEK